MKFLALPALLLLLKSIQPIYSQCSLPAPTNLQSTMTAETAILKWKLSQSVAYYKVRYRKTGDAIWISSPQLNVSSYTISDLQPGTSYDRTETGLSLSRTLPNKVSFGVNLSAADTTVDIEMWIENGTDAALTDLRAQVCLMLKDLVGFEAHTNNNKTFSDPVTTVGNADGTRWVLIAFDPVDRCWGNAKCPCAHVDPQFPDAAPGERKVVRGRIWFYEGKLIATQQKAAESWAAQPRD